LHSLQIFGEQSKFPLLAADGVVLEVGLGVVGLVLLLKASTVHVLFAHTPGGVDPKTAGSVEMS